VCWLCKFFFLLSILRRGWILGRGGGGGCGT
jgi:hypothetical protein